MDNPFNEQKENDKFQIFKGITEAINDWMLKKYPEFDTSLISKMRQIELNVNRLNDNIREHKEFLEKDRKEQAKKIVEEVNLFLSKEYPDLDRSLKLTAKESEKSLKKLQDVMKDQIELQKKFNIYTTLCDDVYKMRDEFKEIQKFMETFQKKIKKAFEI